MLTMHLSQWTTNQETYMVTVCTFIKSNKVAPPHFFPINQVTFSRLPGWSPDRQGSSPRHPALVSVAGPPLHSGGPFQPAGWTRSNWTQPQWGFCIASKVGVYSRKRKKEKSKVWVETERSSSQLLRASGQSRGVKVTLEFSHCTSVQGTKVEIKSSVCDVEVSSFFNEVHNLEGQRVQWVNIRFTCTNISPASKPSAQTRNIFTGYSLWSVKYGSMWANVRNWNNISLTLYVIYTLLLETG